MKAISRTFVRALVPVLLFSAGVVHAHQFWFERGDDGVTFRYGELDQNLHEVSPGGIDRIAKLETTWYRPSGEQAITLVKRPDRLDLPAGVQPGVEDSLVSVDLEYPMFDTARDGKSLRTYWVPATRWVGDLRAREPVLTLDIVPTGQSRDGKPEFQVTYLGEPLAGELVKVSVPSGWSRYEPTDVDGKFAVALPWRGNYSLNLYFIDEVEGVRKLAGQPDEPYQLEGYNSTLSFHVSEGLEPLPVTGKTLPASVLRDMGIAPPKHR